VLGGGIAIYALVYAGLALASGTLAIWPLFALYGVYVAATDGVGKAWVADHVEGPLAGTAYGIYGAAVGSALLVASVLGGVLWTEVGPAATFWVGAAFAVVSLPFVVLAARARPAAQRGAKAAQSIPK
jgi:MFS family permease